MGIELRQARIFVAAAQELHFGRAAGRLHLPQSVVSEQIKRLEVSCGVQLFDRSQRAIRLTAEGEQILPLAVALLDAENNLLEAARASTGRTAGLTLGIARGMGRRLADILRSLSAAGHEVRTVTVSPADRTAMVESGELDAAIVRGRVRSATVRSLHVWDERLTAAMSEHHPCASRERVALRDLVTTPVALVDRIENPALHDVLAGAVASEGLTLRYGMPFTSIEATYASLAASAEPLWTPVYEAYEAQHSYEGIRTALIDPVLVLPAFLIVAPRIAPERRNLIEQACLATGRETAPSLGRVSG